MVKRKLVQICTALLYNGNFAGFTDGNIWKGSSKNICLPGLNCYSCPGALGACPLGSLQSSLSGVFLRIPFYVLGFILLFALIFARLICGWGCPFGLVQELLYKIPTPKLQRNRFTYLLSYLKYFIALVFLLLLPLAFYHFTGSGVPAFCKFICPAGTLEAALPLAFFKPQIRELLGQLFIWKLTLLCLTVLAAIFIYRPFCRFICPLGAIYGLFNKISLFGMKVNHVKCINCNLCMEHCKMDCQHVGDSECIACGECRKVCPVKAISLGKKF